MTRRGDVCDGCDLSNWKDGGAFRRNKDALEERLVKRVREVMDWI